MKIEDILKMNEEYEKKRKELDSFYKQVREASNTIDLEEVKKLDYEEVRKIKSTLCGKLDNEFYEELLLIANDKKIDKYPQFKLPHRYPELKELVQKYGLERILLLDKILAVSSTREYIVFESNYFYSPKMKIPNLKEKELKEIYDFLYKKGIVEYSYTLLDEHSRRKHVSEKDYKLYDKNLQLNERNEKYSYLELYRDEDEEDDNEYYGSGNYKEIYNYEDFKKLTKLTSVRLCKKPLTDEEIINM